MESKCVDISVKLVKPALVEDKIVITLSRSDACRLQWLLSHTKSSYHDIAERMSILQVELERAGILTELDSPPQ